MEDGVVGHKRYANPAMSLDMPYSPRNTVFGQQASHKAHCGDLGQSPEGRRPQRQQILEGKLAPLEWIQGYLGGQYSEEEVVERKN